jgi:hypothetical protein
MKHLLLSVMTILLMANCQLEQTQEITPAFAKLAGKWKLYKISIGYPMPNSPTEIAINKEEIIEFNAVNKVFTRTVDGKVTESTTFDARAISNVNNSTDARDAIVFEQSNMYSFITYNESTSSIILYQSTPIGAILADGNSYYYQKIK